jgi:RNA polymerase sigma-B factor
VSADSDRQDPAARFRQYRRDQDVELRNQLVEQYLVLAKAFARRYRNRGVSVEDLEQVAQMSLIGAVERFDPEVGVKFETFAGRTIDGELKRYFRDKAWSVRVPRKYQDLGVAIRSTLDTLTKELGRAPSIPELAESVGAEVDEVLAAMEASQAFSADSIDRPAAGEDGATTVAETLAGTDTGPSRIDDRELVAELLNLLSPRDRRVVELRFFAERSQRQIAEELGMSQMHVSRLLRKALTTLRDSLNDD